MPKWPAYDEAPPHRSVIGMLSDTSRPRYGWSHCTVADSRYRELPATERFNHSPSLPEPAEVTLAWPLRVVSRRTGQAGAGAVQDAEVGGGSGTEIATSVE